MFVFFIEKSVSKWIIVLTSKRMWKNDCKSGKKSGLNRVNLEVLETRIKPQNSLSSL